MNEEDLYGVQTCLIDHTQWTESFSTSFYDFQLYSSSSTAVLILFVVHSGFGKDGMINQTERRGENQWLLAWVRGLIGCRPQPTWRPMCQRLGVSKVLLLLTLVRISIRLAERRFVLYRNLKLAKHWLSCVWVRISQTAKSFEGCQVGHYAAAPNRIIMCDSSRCSRIIISVNSH